MITAKIIADSVSPDGHRLTTMEVTFHRFILAEFNTHRAFSRNSASSRARSVQKTIQEVDENPAWPFAWAAEQRGMSGNLDIDDTIVYSAGNQWSNARDAAVHAARNLATLGVHKSLINRLLEPFMWHTVVVTATDWDNFFEQRLALLDDDKTPAAQPEMYELARLMDEALFHSVPKKLEIGDWHTPYIRPHDMEIVAAETTPFSVTRLCQISVARCAGVSYLTQGVEGRDHTKDVALFERLRNAEPPHWSPFEHVATPITGLDQNPSGYVDNLRGWESYRAFTRRQP